MKRSLRDCYAKIDRADEHITNLAVETSAFLDTKPYLITYERHPKKGLVLQCHCDDAAIAPFLVRFGTITGEVMHHLRSSLNHLVWQLSDGQHTTSTEFPIFKDKREYKARVGRKVKFITDPKVLALIERAQPYKRAWTKDPLWLVQHLDIVDKHHVLIVAGGSTEFWKNRRRHPTGWSLEEPLISHYVPLKDGAIVAKPIGRPVNMDFKAVYHVVLPQIGRIPSEPLVPRLTQISEYVRVLISKFEPFL